MKSKLFVLIVFAAVLLLAGCKVWPGTSPDSRKLENVVVFMDSDDTVVYDNSRDYPGAGYREADTLIEGLRPVLGNLFQNHVLAIVSQNSFIHIYLTYKDLGIRSFFASVTTPDQVWGHSKPDAEMFDTAFRKTGINSGDKNRVVMVGNNLDTDIIGANNYGIISIWFNIYNENLTGKDYGSAARTPDYTYETPDELLQIINDLQAEYDQNGCLTKPDTVIHY